MTESQLKNAALKHIRQAYPKAYAWHPSDRWISGIPDLIICLDGKFIAIELKFGNGKVSKIQKYVLNKIQDAGGRVAVCRTIKEVKRFIEEIDDSR